MRREARYSPDELKAKFITVLKEIRRIPAGREFTALGLPEVQYYKRAFGGSYGNFLRQIGVKFPERVQYQKQNPKRFFYPQEWMTFLSTLRKDKQRFFFEVLLHTGCRYNEAAHIRVEDINFQKELLFIAKPKGGKGKERTLQISSYLAQRLADYIKLNSLQGSDTLGFPTNAYLNRRMQEALKKMRLNDWRDFSCHNIRKTTEMWLIAINVNYLSIIAHIGHTLNVAEAHYVSTSLFSNEDKEIIKTILGNLLQK